MECDEEKANQFHFIHPDVIVFATDLGLIHEIIGVDRITRIFSSTKEMYALAHFLPRFLRTISSRFLVQGLGKNPIKNAYKRSCDLSAELRLKYSLKFESL